MYRNQFSRALFVTSLIVGLCAFPAGAQQIRMDVNHEFSDSESSQGSTLFEILRRGTTVRLDRGGGSQMVLLVAQVSRGRLVTRGLGDPIELDPRAAASDRGAVLGSVVPLRELRSLSPLSRVGDSVGLQFMKAGRAVGAGELAEQSGVSFMALLDDAFGGNTSVGGGAYGGGGIARRRSPGGGGGYGGGGGSLIQRGDYLVVALVPADTRVRERFSVQPLILVY